MARWRIGRLILVTLLFAGSTVLVWASRTGTLTIFGDQPTLPGSVLLDDPVDLAKGLLDDGSLELGPDGLVLSPTGLRAGAGQCQFDVGHPDIVQFTRLRIIGDQPPPPGTRLQIRLAESLDGMNFGSLGQPIAVEPATDRATLYLTNLVQPNAHYLRIVCELGSDGFVSPILAGFVIDYELVTAPSSAGLGGVSADPATAVQASVNGTVAGTLDTAAPPPAKPARTLAATGLDSRLILAAILAGLGLSALLGGQRRTVMGQP